MNIIHKLRKPLLPKEFGDRLSLNQIEHKPVAIIVVASIMMIKLWRRRAFALGAERFAIPVGDDIDTVRIGRRQQQQDRIIKNFLSVGVVRICEIIRQIHRHLRRDDLGRMDRTSDRNDRLAIFYQIFEFCGIFDRSRVG